MTVALNKAAVLDRAYAFAKDYAEASYEMGQAQDFIRDFCDVFGFSHKRLVSFERRVKKLGGGSGRIDGFYPGKLLIEMKSRGQDLAAAFQQATDYLAGLTEAELPRYILVSDFAHLHLYDLQTKAEPLTHSLADFAKHIDAYLFLAGFEAQAQQAQIEVNEQAARQIAALHDAMREGGYTGADLERYMVRILFCLFADDTGIFEANGALPRYLRQHTREDGTDLDGALQNLFDTLNRPADKRPKSLPDELRGFPYINGSVFAGQLERCYFNAQARALLIACAEQFDWSQISPAIFGSLFQAVIHHDDEGLKAKSSKRRALGAHYTSEANILRVIRPLFLDALTAEFRARQRSKAGLQALLHKLRGLTFLDPACGCGNFLVIAYRELRRLELDAVEALHAIAAKSRTVSATLDAKEFDDIQCDVHQFHGIEIEASAAHIATVALWLTDHQENQRASRALGGNFNRLPLDKAAHIVCANALTTDWASVLPPGQCSYVIGNPPFIGKKEQSPAQKAAFQPVMGLVHGSGVLDFVAAWYIKATSYILRNQSVRAAFVSTNSITQGEQVSILWGWMLAQGIRIQFAHRTFQWSNDAKGVAAVHCVIVGFGTQDLPGKSIFQYADIRGEPLPVAARNINPYLVDADDALLPSRREPLGAAPEIKYGSFALDDGQFTLDAVARNELLIQDASAERFLRPFIGGEELINGTKRWCLWLKGANPTDIRSSAPILRRVEAVKQWRSSRDRETTRKLAATPTLFAEIRQPTTAYVGIPTVSSERRKFIPIAFLPHDVIASNQLYILANATLLHFGVLTSTMHNAWVRSVCGRLKSDYRYSAAIVYNNFPWPNFKPNQSQALVKPGGTAIEIAAQAVLNARAQFPDASLADLYDPLAMPATLVKAHQALDRAVDAAYDYKGSPDDAARVAFLFGLYQQLTAATAPVGPSLAKPKRKKQAHQ